MTRATEPPQDILHATRDEAYRQQAQLETAFFDKPRMMDFDVQSPVMDAYRNEVNTGGSDLPWHETIPKYGTFERGCALGAGGTKQRTRILHQNPRLHLTIYDISKESLAILERELGTQFPGRVATKQTDLNFVELPEKSFDLFISSSCIHHLYNLEHVAFQINRSLTPDGYFFLEDYVGEARFRFSEEKKRMFEEALAGAQKRQRAIRHWRIVWPDPDNWLFSPFEALRSDETIGVFRRYLKEVEVHTAGAIVDLILFIQPPRPLGRAESAIEALRRRLASLKSTLLGDNITKNEALALLAQELIPVDREVSREGRLAPASAFAVYRKRGEA